METLTVIITISTVVWIIVDRFKSAWSSLSWGKYLTTLSAGILAIFAVWSLNLDVLCALGVYENPILFGEVITILAIAGGSSLINEIIKK